MLTVCIVGYNLDKEDRSHSFPVPYDQYNVWRSRDFEDLRETLTRVGKPVDFLVIFQNRAQNLLALFKAIPMNRIPEKIYVVSQTVHREWLSPRIPKHLKQKIKFVPNQKSIPEVTASM